jgi:hypothetical protein
MTNYAPIVLFTYCRADHTRIAVESLLNNKEAAESDLYIFSDGPKTEEKRKGVEENRTYIHTITGFKSIHIIEREKNWGLANSLIAGITEIINQYGRIIVVEDDLILSPYFLQFMNEALEKYKDDDRVGTISAFVPQIKEELPNTFFLKYYMCWGWATWKRSWDMLELNPKPLLRKLRFKKKKFDVGGGVGNYGNLYCQKVGLVDSWYVRFYASLFLKDKLSLYPGLALAANNGLDGTGTHSSRNAQSLYHAVCYNKPIHMAEIPVKEDDEAYRIFSEHYKMPHRNTPKEMWAQVKGFIRRLLYIDCL